MSDRGVFITIEGGETVGKSTQTALLSDRIRSDLGREVEMTREPGGTPLSEALRGTVLSGLVRHSPETEALLFAAARAIHVDRRIRPALARGTIVVCDRFIDSTRALQGASGLGDEILEPLIDQACDGLMPDLTFVMTLPDELLRQRLEAKGLASGLDAFESRGNDYHMQVNRRFGSLPGRFPDRCVQIDASGSIDEVHNRIWAALLDTALLSGAGVR